MSWEKLTCTKSERGLGFRDLRTFNLAMMDKHGWHLLTKPQSLVSRVLKGRYYLRSSFNPSFVWRSLWQSRKILTIDCMRSIGDGSNIMVMNACWLSGKVEDFLNDPQVQGAYVITVQNLLLPNVK